MDTPHPPTPPRRRGAALLVVWFAATVLAGSTLLGRHLLPFDDVQGDDAQRALAGLRAPGSSRWTVVHVLYAGCRCSVRIADHLAASARPADVDEVVLWVGDGAPPPALTRPGMRVIVMGAAELARDLHVETAPLLAVVDPGGRVPYVGGYTRRKQSDALEDGAIVAAARADRAPGALPIFGCAVSERLRAAVRTVSAL